MVMEPELLELFAGLRGLTTALTLAVVLLAVSKVMPHVVRFYAEYRRRNHPDTYITYDNCIIEKDFDKEHKRRF